MCEVWKEWRTNWVRERLLVCYVSYYLTCRYRTQRTSHPVGTTVRITDFLKHIPVRRQTTLKSAAKSLTRIKKLLQSYAISQPSKRLSLKVLKATNEKNNWSYAPSTNPSLPGATLEVAGKDIFSSCVLKQLCSKVADETETTSLERCTFEVVAFLPDSQPGEPYLYFIS